MNNKITDLLLKKLESQAYSENDLSSEKVFEFSSKLLNEDSLRLSRRNLTIFFCTLLVFLMTCSTWIVISQGISELMFTKYFYNIKDSTLKLYYGSTVFIAYLLIQTIIKYYFQTSEKSLLYRFVEKIFDKFFQKSSGDREKVY